MRLAITAFVGAAAGLALASAVPQSAAAQPPAGQNACFRTSDMHNHTIVNDHTIYFDVFPRKVYELTTTNSCFAGAFPTDPLIMNHIPPNSNLVCSATDIDLKVAHGGVPSPCIIGSIRQLTPAEVAAIPPKLKP